MSAWASPTQFQQAYNKPVMTMKGGAELQRALLDLARAFGDNPVEDVLFRAVKVLENSVQSRVPSNQRIFSMCGIDRLPSGEPPPKSKGGTQKSKPLTGRNRLRFLFWVNRIAPGQHEIKDAIHVEHGRTQRPKVYLAAHYRRAHHIFWVEYGKQGIPKWPYMRPGLTAARRAMIQTVKDGMQLLVASRSTTSGASTP